MDLLSLHNTAKNVSAKTEIIRDMILAESKRIREPNFGTIHPDDLARLFALYDERFFDGWLGKAVIDKTKTPLTFRLSSTMTRAGGKTIRTRIPQGSGGHKFSFEIAIGSRLLFMTFGDVDRPVTVCGLSCENRLQALQRIMEHEIIHLAELLFFDKSSCSAGQFKFLAKNIFHHADTKHDLVTPIELAAVQHGIRLRQKVEFRFHGVRHIGMVNRIHHRATVLVESGEGRKHTDGKRYLKFYMPLRMLTPVR
jgi:hypothetical protein